MLAGVVSSAQALALALAQYSEEAVSATGSER